MFASGSIMNQALKAQEILDKDYNISADIWSATNYKQCRTDALNCQMQHVKSTNPKESYVETVLKMKKVCLLLYLITKMVLVKYHHGCERFVLP